MWTEIIYSWEDASLRQLILLTSTKMQTTDIHAARTHNSCTLTDISLTCKKCEFLASLSLRLHTLMINHPSDITLSLVHTLKSKINIFFGQNKFQGPKCIWTNQVGGTFGTSWSCWALLSCVWDHTQIVEAQLRQSSVGRPSDNINPPESGLNRSVNIWFYLLQTVNTAKREKTHLSFGIQPSMPLFSIYR